MLKSEEKFSATMSPETEKHNNQEPAKQSSSKKQVNSNQEHSFLMDQSYMHQMQDGLLELLDDFKQGKKNGFDNNESLSKMNDIKKMQENLAQLHFKLENEDNDKRTALSEDERTKRSQEKIDRLMKNV